MRFFFKQTGFTMMELIVVILLLSIIAAYAASRWSSGVTPSAQAQQLAADIRFTQSLAMTHNQTYVITFTPATTPDSYNIATQATPGTPLPSLVTGNTSTSFVSNTAFGVITINGVTTNQQIFFDDFGIPYAAYTSSTVNTPLSSVATIKITSGGSTRTISISPTTGFVTVT